MAIVPKPMSAPSAPSTNDSKMKLSLPVSSVMRRGASSRMRRVSANRTASNDASLIATTVGISIRRSSVSRENSTPASAGCSWNSTIGSGTASAIARWYSYGTSGGSPSPANAGIGNATSPLAPASCASRASSTASAVYRALIPASSGSRPATSSL